MVVKTIARILAEGHKGKVTEKSPDLMAGQCIGGSLPVSVGDGKSHAEVLVSARDMQQFTQDVQRDIAGFQDPVRLALYHIEAADRTLARVSELHQVHDVARHLEGARVRLREIVHTPPVRP